jgi:hypothetical protein
MQEKCVFADGYTKSTNELSRQPTFAFVLHAVDIVVGGSCMVWWEPLLLSAVRSGHTVGQCAACNCEVRSVRGGCETVWDSAHLVVPHLTPPQFGTLDHMQPCGHMMPNKVNYLPFCKPDQWSCCCCCGD